jgi:hypothetical protein
MSTTWSLNAGALITRAYRILGNLNAPWVPTDDQLNQGLIALNAMLKGWQLDGINLYRQTQLSLAVPTGIGYAGNPFQITPLIMGFEEGRWVVQPAPNLYERPLAVYSYIDYMNLPNKLAKASSGPSVVCFDKQVNASNFYFWPLPTNGGTMNCTVARTTNDVNFVTDPLDFPSEWTEDAIYTLADRLMDDSGMAASDPATADRIQRRAAAFYSKALNFDRPTSVYVRPWGRKGSGKFWR